VGEKKGSYQTPRGHHIICEKIGADLPIFTVFQARKPTGEIFSPELEKQFPDRDWILSRILWLAGTEAGVNCGGDVDTQQRFIYIHGTNDEKNMGTPNSHGCIRMRNSDVIELFDRVILGMPAHIQT
ncbi:MAG: peptidase, partial [Gammaproteobacteria bacterium RIFCSPHIGHO2_12_FULL_40_19]